jgi:type VI protein secretion system component VasK
MIVDTETTRNGHPVSRATLQGRAANRAMRELRRRYYSEYYEIYTAELDKLGVKRLPYNDRINTIKQLVSLSNQVDKLKALLAANNIEVVEFEDDRSWNYPKPKEQEED